MDSYDKYLKDGRIKVMGHFYKFTEDNHMGRDTNTAGQSCGNALWIKIDGTLPITNKQTTLIHELIEQLDYLMEIGLKHEQICNLESGLFSIVRDNPDIFSFSTGGEIHHVTGGTNENTKS